MHLPLALFEACFWCLSVVCFQLEASRSWDSYCRSSATQAAPWVVWSLLGGIRHFHRCSVGDLAPIFEFYRLEVWISFCLFEPIGLFARKLCLALGIKLYVFVFLARNNSIDWSDSRDSPLRAAQPAWFFLLISWFIFSYQRAIWICPW